MESYRAPRKLINQRFKRITNIVTERDEKTQEGIAHMPGMAFTDFSRAGVPTAFALARTFDLGGRMTLANMDDVVTEEKQLVVLGQTISISPLFHQRARVRFPMKLRSHLIQVGNSSMSVEFLVTDGEFGDVLIRTRRSFTLMSATTGRSLRFPDQARMKFYSRLHEGRNQTVKILKEFPSKPEGIPRHPVIVRHSDTDTQYHSNQASYFTYFMEASTEGAKRGRFKLLKGDLLSHPISLLECLYKGESHPGDELEVYVWEDETNSAKLWGQIEMKGKTIWMGQIGFRVGIGSQL